MIAIPMDLDEFAKQFLRRMDNGEFDGRMNHEISRMTEEQLLRVTDLVREWNPRKPVPPNKP